MTLQPDCIRDILLAVESCDFGVRLSLDSLQTALPQYTEEELWYTILKLHEADLLDATVVRMMGMKMPGIKSINDLTYNGHEFLNAVRGDKTWDKVKDVAKTAGTFSLKSLMDIGKAVASAAINAALQSPP